MELNSTESFNLHLILNDVSKKGKDNLQQPQLELAGKLAEEISLAKNSH